MSFLNDIFGSKPKVPKLEELDPTKIQQRAVEGNLAVLPSASQLAERTNLFNRQEIEKMLEAAGGGELLSDSANIIKGFMAGDLPLADRKQRELKSIAASFGSGTAGSGSMGNLVARDLGLAELDLIGKGLSSAESWLKTTASLFEPGMMNLTTMFLTPTQRYAMENEQNNQQFQREWMRNQVSAMPDPVAAGIQQNIHEAAMAFLGAYGGSMGGGAAKGATTPPPPSGGGGGGGGGYGGFNFGAMGTGMGSGLGGGMQGGWNDDWMNQFSSIG